MSENAASAVARAVVRPDEARTMLAAPIKYRIPGAELLAIRVEMYTTRVAADATNPRTLNDMIFPAAIKPGDPRILFAPLEPPTSDGHDFMIRVSSLDQLVWQLNQTMSNTKKENTPRPPIGEQGVMEAPLAVPAQVVDSSGTPVGGIVLIREGSSRISHAQAILGVDGGDVVRKYVDDKAQKELVEELNEIAKSSASTISDSEAARIRVATVPIDLVVGVEPDPSAEITLGEAVAAKVAQDHLNHKQEWKSAAKEVHLGEQCLSALHEEGLISDDEKLWLAGRMAPPAVVDKVTKLEDDRWTELLWFFTTRARPQSVVIRRPIATVLERDGGRSNVTWRDRVPLAVALAMRARRGLVTDSAIEKESKLLENSVPGVVWNSVWTPTTTTIADLVRLATAEATTRTPGSASAELAARAVWYLAKNGQVSMPRNDLGIGGDRRPPSELVTGMLSTVRGIQQLGRAVEDGRSGRHAGLVIDDDGTIDKSGVGDPVELSDDDVRNTFVPKGGPTPPPPPNPRAEFMDAVARVAGALQSVRTADDDLRIVEDGHGQLMFQIEGVDVAQVDDLLGIVRNIESNLTEYAINRKVAERAGTLASGPES
jgi:hypothetical protein